MMRAKNKVIGAVGAAIGLAMTVAMAVAPASARPASEPASVTSTYSCASFEGLKVTAPSVSYSGVGLRTGETITVSVSPAAAGDTIRVNASVGLSFNIVGGDALLPLAFTSGSDSVYNTSWYYRLANGTASTTSRTWTFDCSSTTVAAPAPEPTPTTEPAPTKGKGKGKPRP